ncbi:MAG: TonB family protein [Roseovarius sp.]|jgi:protein TonB|uniref:energy transducer TonB family protein n=1 Tax=Roseovarius sp. TaxID=1486281 RepID=UPI0032EEB010
MIRRSRVVLSACAGVALVLHGAGLWVSDSAEKIEIAGGAGAVEAALGSSFADMAAGVAQPVSEATVTPNRQAEDGVDPAEPVETRRPETPQAAARAPAETAETPPPDKAALPADTVAAARVTPTPSPPAAAVPVRPSAALPVQRPATPTRETSERASSAPQEVIEAQPEAGLQVSRRPQARPRAIEETAARQSPEPERRETRSRSRQGNNASRDAITGSAAGRESAAAARQGRDTSRQSSAQGNAAASNYPGEVMRHLARVPRPRAASRGAALVRFSIGAGGRLASVGIARSSGSSRLDRAALTVVERAAPFPAPPRGAQTSFSVRIEGR